MSGHIHHTIDDHGRIHLSAVGAVTIEPYGRLNHQITIVAVDESGATHTVSYGLVGLVPHEEAIVPAEPTTIEVLTPSPVHLVEDG